MQIIVVPSLKCHLLSSTAMTPTNHKGGIGAVVGIVAAIAIPFAAPGLQASQLELPWGLTQRCSP
jgi:hypothetical protein